MSAPGRDWAERPCPLCAGTGATVLYSPSADAIAAGNWSYRADVARACTEGAPREFPIVRCSRCGFVYARLLPPGPFLNQVYDEVIDTATARSHSFTPEALAVRMGALSSLLRIVPAPMRVLDYGCGFGPSLMLLRSAESVSAVGYETSAARVRSLRAEGFEVHADPEAIARSGPYDAVILDNVLEHVPDPHACIRTLASLCKPGARMLVGVPDMSRARLDAMIRQARAGGPSGMELNPWEHLSYFDVRHLDGLMSGHGFAAIPRSELPGEVSVGLRPQARFAARARNAIASAWRGLGYAITGDTLRQPTQRFYRLTAAQERS